MRSDTQPNDSDTILARYYRLRHAGTIDNADLGSGYDPAQNRWVRHHHIQPD
jgi:hypothetical protein